MSANEKLKQDKQAEQQLLKQMFPNHQINLQLDYEKWDLLIPDKGYIIEVKVRNKGYQTFKTYNDESPLIEVAKYEANIRKAKQMGLKFIYVFGFRNEDTKEIEGFQAWNLTDLQPEDFIKLEIPCPEYSFIPSRTVLKDCFIIPATLFNNENRYTKIYA